MTMIRKKSNITMSALLGALIVMTSSNAVYAWDWSFTSLFSTALAVTGIAYITSVWRDWKKLNSNVRYYVPFAHKKKEISVMPAAGLAMQYHALPSMPRFVATTNNNLAVDNLLAHDALLHRATDSVALAFDNMPENMRDENLEKIYIKNHVVYGWKKQFSKKNRTINLKQPIVAYQGKRTSLNCGGAASCGYHSLKNFCLAARGLSGTNTMPFDVGKALCSFNLVNELFRTGKEYDQMGAMRKQVVYNNPTDHGLVARGGDWLEQEYLSELLKAQALPGGLLDGVPYYCAVIENIDNVTLESVQTYNMQELLGVKHRQLQNAKNLIERDRSVSCYGFILNDLHEGTRAGHWFTVVVYTNGATRDYIIMDSLNIPRLENKSVKALLRALGDA